MWLYYANRELQPAKKIGEQLRTIAQRAQDPELNLQAHHALWTISFFLGNFVKAREHAEQGMIIYDPQQHRSHAYIYGGHDPGVCCRYFGATAMWFLGYPDQALDRINEAVSLAQDLSHPSSLVIALVFAAQLHQYRREPQPTQKRAEAAIALASEHGITLFLTWATILQGWALAAQGKEDEGIALIHKGLAAYRALGAEVDRSYFLSLLAEAYGKVGQPEEGLTVLFEALTIVDNTGQRYWEAELHRRKGELLLIQQGQKVGEAEACFGKALDIGRRQQAKSLELRAAMNLSLVWQKQGKQGEAHQLLTEIYGWFTEGFDTADLKKAKVLLEDLA
jgi:predicted ATPase